MCDGGWEHCYGVKIDTLDNPGWGVEIYIIDTPLENKTFSEYKDYVDEDNWIICTVENGVFMGAGDPHKLPEIIRVFKNWSEN